MLYYSHFKNDIQEVKQFTQGYIHNKWQSCDSGLKGKGLVLKVCFKTFTFVNIFTYEPK